MSGRTKEAPERMTEERGRRAHEEALRAHELEASLRSALRQAESANTALQARAARLEETLKALAYGPAAGESFDQFGVRAQMRAQSALSKPGGAGLLHDRVHAEEPGRPAHSVRTGQWCRHNPSPVPVSACAVCRADGREK